jgi:hypothetical protein
MLKIKENFWNKNQVKTIPIPSTYAFGIEIN